ncbi:CPBP family glutamic-type intramembrane protease [Carboxylicivirga caseinilyticus]|uniref:CPBP family glutamic-type intramembrane protease n=1 Tax=Carboxylicivirga caseinilyticus TaxID=3417572 RepID=UPI003D32C10F|nr:CPBP family intramembrane metalloprotease [Marinilabiliaceae bacterium A049]
MKNPKEQTNKKLLIEIGLVLLTGAGKFLFMDYLNWRLLFIVCAITFWVLYVVFIQKKDKEALHMWGFRTDNFWKVTGMVTPFGVIAIILFTLIGWYQNTLNFTWHLLPILILYPMWGIVQQFLVIGIIAGNLQSMKTYKIPAFINIILTAILFGLFHYPFWWLVTGTFFLALFYGYIYLKQRNIYVLGIFHGWLGALFYYTVVGRDPFLEVFGKYF